MEIVGNKLEEEEEEVGISVVTRGMGCKIEREMAGEEGERTLLSAWAGASPVVGEGFLEGPGRG